MRYLSIVAVLVVLGGAGILLFATSGEDEPTPTATVTEGGTAAPRQVGSAGPSAPKVGDGEIKRARLSADGAAPADVEEEAPLVTAALEDDDEIERTSLAPAPQDDGIERQSAARRGDATDGAVATTEAPAARPDDAADEAVATTEAPAARPADAADEAGATTKGLAARSADAIDEAGATAKAPAARPGDAADDTEPAAPRAAGEGVAAVTDKTASAATKLETAEVVPAQAPPAAVAAPTSVAADGDLPGVRSIAALRVGAPSTAVAALRKGGSARAARTLPAVAAVGGPTFDIVRISASGSAVIAGRAEPGANVVVLDRGETLGQVKANRRGEWVLIPVNPLPPGATQLHIESTLPGVPPRQSDDVVVLSVPERAVAASARPIAVLTPRGGGATRVLQGTKSALRRERGDSGVTLDVVDYDQDGNVILSGRAEPNTEVRAYADNRLVGTVRSDGDGVWQLSPEAQITPGEHELRVDSVTSDGTVLARVAIPFSRADAAGLDLRDGRVVVQPGNSLWRIARATYGSGIQFTLIYDANRDRIGDPDLIFPGQVFRIPKTN